MRKLELKDNYLGMKNREKRTELENETMQMYTCILREKRTNIENEIMKMYTGTV